MSYEEDRIKQLELLTHAQTRALDSRGFMGMLRRWWLRARFRNESLVKQIRNDELFAQNIILKRKLREVTCKSCGSKLIE